jgi:choline kinase
VINEGIKNLKVTKRNTIRIQGNRKEVCGEYCVAYCLAKARNVDTNDFIRQWMETDNRDDVIQQMMKSRLETIASKIDKNLL